jgi:hypothetical protein
MPPTVRKLGLTAHVISSLGWLGAVSSFLALAIAGLGAADGQHARAVYQSMDLVTTWVIVPFCLASLLTGIVQSLGTSWGLFRHYWVVLKLVLTTAATVVLFIHVQPIRDAALASSRGILSPEMRGLQIQLVGDAAFALAVLVVATVLGVYKPRGLTAYGWRLRTG